MAFYHSKNAPLKIDNKVIFCSQISLNEKSEIQPAYKLDDRSTSDYTPTNGIIGTCDFTYYLTGNDYIKSLISNDYSLVSGNFGGLSFTSGKLHSLSFNCTPNRPVEANASIVFFDKLQGQFTPVSAIRPNYPLLNFSDVTINPLNTYSTETITNITNLNYSYNADVQAAYIVDENIDGDSTIPQRILINQKTITTDISCDNILPYQSIFGQKAGVRINFTHPSLPLLNENLTCSGLLSQKNFRTMAGNIIGSEISVIQNHVNLPPYIDSFSPPTANVGDTVTVLGKNFTSVTSVHVFREVESFVVENLVIVDDNTLTFKIGPEGHSGKIIVRNLWGVAKSSTQLTVTFNPIAIRSLQRSAGHPGDTIAIYGDYLQNVTNISFGGIPANSFSTLLDGVLVEVPQGALLGPVIVSSEQTLQTGASPFHFAPAPKISGFGPVQGVAGNTVLITGWNFTGITGVLFNTTPASSITTLSQNLISVVVPGGWTRGYLTVSGISGFSAVSSGIFEPQVQITSVTPTSGYAFTKIVIDGTNFDTGLFYPFPSGGWQVGIGNSLTGFYLNGANKLSGYSPSGEITGPIKIYKYDQSTYPSNFSWHAQIQPEPIFISPTGSYSGMVTGLFITGNGLYYINTVRLTGSDPSNLGTTINIPSQYIKNDSEGHWTSVTGYNFAGTPTGQYGLMVLDGTRSGILTGNFTIYQQYNKLSARNIRVNQSSTGYTGDPYPFSYRPEYAIDQVETNSMPVALTNSDSGAFWECKLLYPKPISRIVIFPYATGIIPILNNFSGMVLNNGRDLLYGTFIVTPNLPSHTLQISPPVNASIIRICKESGIIGLGEIEAY